MNEVINITGKDRDATPAIRASLFFYGDNGNPFLAPRGLHTVDGKLIVADTGNHRIIFYTS